jgi:hypothetical protein
MSGANNSYQISRVVNWPVQVAKFFYNYQEIIIVREYDNAPGSSHSVIAENMTVTKERLPDRHFGPLNENQGPANFWASIGLA